MRTDELFPSGSAWPRPRPSPPAVDARPSDAIALALRARAPVFVAKKIIEKAAGKGKKVPPGAPVAHAELLAGLSESAFGKWKM